MLALNAAVGKYGWDYGFQTKHWRISKGVNLCTGRLIEEVHAWLSCSLMASLSLDFLACEISYMKGKGREGRGKYLLTSWRLIVFLFLLLLLAFLIHNSHRPSYINIINIRTVVLRLLRTYGTLVLSMLWGLSTRVPYLLIIRPGTEYLVQGYLLPGAGR